MTDIFVKSVRKAIITSKQALYQAQLIGVLVSLTILQCISLLEIIQNECKFNNLPHKNISGLWMDS